MTLRQYVDADHTINIVRNVLLKKMETIISLTKRLTE
jgi:hypothetical protein